MSTSPSTPPRRRSESPPRKTPPHKVRQTSRSRTPPRKRALAEHIVGKLDRRLRTHLGPGRRFEDVYTGRLPAYRLLDVDSCLKEFCPDRETPTSIVVLGCGPGTELDAVREYFQHPGSTLAVDVCDWSSHAKPPVAFRQLDLRADKDRVIQLLRDDTLLPPERRLLIIVSCVAMDHYRDLMCDYVADVPAHADVLLLEPLSRSDDEHDLAVDNRASADWIGFVYRGGPTQRACFYSRWEVPMRPKA